MCGGWVGEIPGRRSSVAAALLFYSGSNDVVSPPGKRWIQHWQGWTLFFGSLEIHVAYSWCILATSPVFRGLSVRFTSVPKFIWDWSLNCYKFRLNLNFSAEHWTPGKFPQERSFWMDLKIQHSCGLTTSQLKGSGFSFLQSDPHCDCTVQQLLLSPQEVALRKQWWLHIFSDASYHAFGREKICTVDLL